MGEIQPLPKVLVTGATGRLGKMLQTYWEKEPPLGQDVIWSSRQHANGKHRNWLKWDLSQETTDLPADCIVLHLAAKIKGDAGELSQNTVFAKNVLKSAERAKAKHILFVSSVAVVGTSGFLLSESMLPAPVSEYAKAKFAAEQVFQAAKTNCKVSILRIANVIGADALLAAAESGREVILDPVPNQEGGPVRTWIGPVTLAKTLAQLITHVATGNPIPNLLNVACQPPIPMADILNAAGYDWSYGDANPSVNARSAVATDVLSSLVDMPKVTATSLIAEWNQWRRSNRV